MAKKYWFLRVGDDSLDEAKRCSTKATAVWRYQQVARELAQYEQESSASIHQACTRDLIDEYPDYVLALGPRGGVQVQSPAGPRPGALGPRLSHVPEGPRSGCDSRGLLSFDY